MATLRRTPLAIGLGLYSVMWIGGIVAYLFRGGPGAHEAWTAPAFLAIAALLVLATSSQRSAAWLAVVLLTGYASEYIGVRCDCVFGPYSYTEALAPRIFGVPIVMSAAWMILIAYVKGMLVQHRVSRATEVIAGAAWMTVIDLVIDPVAAGPLRYWQWESTGPYYGIPWSNFAGWFLVSAVIFVMLRMDVARWRHNPWALHIGASIILFFAIIAASYGMWLCGTIGMLLIVLHLVLTRRPGR